ncbi:LuxR C-terminal-related transcriptional regulator [Reichenbachiella agarivorans]|uniref:LuxR C-terminal-related transcriptional regulator n=1 Tax=Reichenbachiella agarivorans TaxID=2979464 RepID=A0ABY6CM16_9BACT|nr:LuxR C-terminal-related transcriptional regulator [Reichenbachiella agarivorans]UXP31567.1 LuxR C-terminal-related transcriptional regulator [Reichenbachiella agarivorans]
MSFKSLFLILFFIPLGMNAAVAQTIQYLHIDTTLHEVKQLEDKQWINYTEPIYEGTNNGIYWFKIEIPASSDTYVITIPESHITRASLYQGENEIAPVANTRYLSFLVRASPSTTSYYLRVNCRLEARVPLSVEKSAAYYSAEQYEFLSMGIYYGVVISVIFINLFSFFSFGNKGFIQYLFMPIGMSINSVYKDGIFALLLGPVGINEYLEPTLNSVLVITCIFCIDSYLRINRHYPRLYRFGIGLVILSQLLNVGVLLTKGSFWFYVSTELVILMALDIFWLSGFLLWRKTKSLESGWFSLAYGLPLFVAHGYYLSPYFGLHFMNVSFVWYKVGSVFEMAIFTYAIMHQSKKISLKNQEMRQKIVDYTTQLTKLHERPNEKEAQTLELIKRYRFTLKEIEILQDIADGSTNKEIAEKHFISQNTVKYHIRNIFEKLDVNNRKEAGDKLMHPTDTPTAMTEI